MVNKTYKLGLLGLFISTFFLYTSNNLSNTFGECITGQKCIRGIGSKNLNYSYIPTEVRECGEIVFHFSRREAWFITNILTFCLHYILMPLDIFGKELGNYKDSILNFQPTYGVKAIKICGSCEEFAERSDRIKGFEEYCGKDVYGYNETVSGLILVPMDDSAKTVKSGGLNTTFWMHGFVSHLGPSENLPKTSLLWFAAIFETGMAFIKGGMAAAYDKEGKALLNQFGSIMIASRGILVIAPDYLGYGNDKTLYKGFSISKPYQTSCMPLWFKSKSVIEEISGSRSYVLDNTFVHGASEGSMAVMPVAHSLHHMGVNVTAYPSAVPNYIETSAEIMKRMFTVLKGGYPDVFMSFFAYMLTPFSSLSPYSNVSQGYGLASVEGERMMDLIVNNEVSFGIGSKLAKEGLSTSPDCLRNGTGCPTYLNPIIVNAMVKVAHLDPWNNTEYLPCQRKNEVPELSLLCEEISKVTSHQFFASAEYPVQICHHSLDKVSKFVDMTELYPEKKNLRIAPSQEQWATVEKNRGIKIAHSSSSLACNFYAALDIMLITNL